MPRLAGFVAATIAFLALDARGAEPIRVGMIGLDTSHAVAFTKILNDPQALADVAGCRVVVAMPQGSPDLAASASRVEALTAQVRDLGVEIVGTIDEVLATCDVVLLESVDGRAHLPQALPVLRAGKPVFIDKPLAASLERIRIWCSTPARGRQTSPLRGLADSRCGRSGHTLVERSPTPSPTSPNVPTRRYSKTKCAPGDAGERATGDFSGYRPLVVEIVNFRTGKSPVPPAETLAIMAFLEAADESKRRAGAEVSLADTLARAREAAAARLAALGE